MRGMFCKTCDAVIYTTLSLSEYRSDPKMRMELIADLERQNVRTWQDMQRIASERGASKLRCLALSVRAYVWHVPAWKQSEVLPRAMQKAKFDAQREIDGGGLKDFRRASAEVRATADSVKQQRKTADEKKVEAAFDSY